MIRRPVFPHVALVLLAGLSMVTSGCGADAAPAPSPTGFASDAEAFAAAEKTYRAYVDAVNARRTDPHSTPAPEEFLIGQALEGEIDGARRLAAVGITVMGESRVGAVEPSEATSSSVVLLVCLDATDARALNGNGVDVTPEDRPPVVRLQVEFARAGADLLIADSAPAETQSC